MRIELTRYSLGSRRSHHECGIQWIWRFGQPESLTPGIRYTERVTKLGASTWRKVGEIEIPTTSLR
jgi:hypothetical protein